MYKVKGNIIIASICAIILSTGSFYIGKAADNPDISYKSQGRIVFDNHTPDTADDVVFDASDFVVINNMVVDGKTNIKEELNKYEGINISEDIPTFATLAASINAISDGTDALAEHILSGEKAIVGKNVVIGSMNDYSAKEVSPDSIIENGDRAEIAIPGGYYNTDSRICIPIETIIQNSNLAGVYYLGTGTSFSVAGRFPNDYQNFTANNFIVSVTSGSYASSGSNGTGVWNGMEYGCRADGFNISKSYNSSTGVLSVGGNAQTISTTGQQGGGSTTQYLTCIVYLVNGKIS